MSTESASESSATALTCNARGQSLARMEQYGIDELCDRLSNGESQADIARDLGVSLTRLNMFLNRPTHAEQYARARDASAEAWADRAWTCLQLEDDEIDAARVNLARHKEQHCMRRAGIANARYSERQSVELSGPNGGPIQQAVVHVFVPANNRDVAHTVDDEG